MIYETNPYLNNGFDPASYRLHSRQNGGQRGAFRFYFANTCAGDCRAIGNAGQIHAGDLMLYGSDCLVLFYESFPTSYRYTPIGRINDPSDLADAVGSSGVQVIFALR